MSRAAQPIRQAVSKVVEVVKGEDDESEKKETTTPSSAEEKDASKSEEKKETKLAPLGKETEKPKNFAAKPSFAALEVEGGEDEEEDVTQGVEKLVV